VTPPNRRAYIDWARGLAVLLMIEAHTTDAWTRPADKTSSAYGMAVILGGFAAPLFLWLAGLGVAFGASRIVERTGSRAQAVETMCRRGLEIFVLAFLFRLQAFIVSPPSTPLKIFRVDILNVMGPAMVGAALVWAVGEATRARVVTYGLVATAIAMATPVVRATHAVEWLPVWMQWYLRPAGEFTTFTLFPWAGFVFAGGAVGTLVAAAGNGALERRLHGALAVVGVVLIAGGFVAAGQPTIYRSSSFWTSSPTWFAVRVGIVTLALSFCFIIERLSHDATQTPAQTTLRAVMSSWQHPLAKMGRASLFVYWIHVELVYGYASWLWRGRLPLWGAVLGFMAFTVAMYGAIGLRDRVVANWRKISANRSSGPVARGVRP
jgi:uncharacterized membrane protein